MIEGNFGNGPNTPTATGLVTPVSRCLAVAQVNPICLQATDTLKAFRVEPTERT
jgi:hypothetical protein